MWQRFNKSIFKKVILYNIVLQVPLFQTAFIKCLELTNGVNSDCTKMGMILGLQLEGPDKNIYL